MTSAAHTDENWPEEVVGSHLYAVVRRQHATSGSECLEFVFSEPGRGKTLVLASAQKIEVSLTNGVFTSDRGDETWVATGVAAAIPGDNEEIRLLFHKLWSRAAITDNHYDKSEWQRLLGAVRRGGYDL